MKTWKNLFDKIVSLDNILLAHKKARRNKTNRSEVQKVDKDPVYYCKQIRSMLINGTYRTSQYKTFKIYEPKERIIFKLPYFPDRIIHHAIMNIMEPLWVNLLIPNTYSCIKGRGIHKALKDIRRDLKDVSGTKYCLKLDITKFYPSIDHDLLKKIIRIKLADKKLLKVLDEIIDSSDGVPIGNYLSQFFANMFLCYFDRWVKEQTNIKYYYRYADDIVMLYKDKQYLHNLLLQIIFKLNELKLKIKDNYQVFPTQVRGVDFVGYKTFHTHCLIRDSIKKRFIKRNKRYTKLQVSYEFYRLKVASYLGWFKYANCYNLLNKKLLYKELLRYVM